MKVKIIYCSGDFTVGKIYEADTPELIAAYRKRFGCKPTKSHAMVDDKGYINGLTRTCCEIVSGAKELATKLINATVTKTDSYTAHRNKLVAQGVEIDNSNPIQNFKRQKDNSHWVDPIDLLADDTGKNSHD